jgi:hypothetical protein
VPEEGAGGAAAAAGGFGEGTGEKGEFVGA